MRATTRIFFIVFLLTAPLSGCGQTGALFIPPGCSPVLADGRVRELKDEDGEILPPCPAAEDDADDEQTLQDEELPNDDI